MEDHHIKTLKWFEKELMLSLNVQSLLVPLQKSKLITPWEKNKLTELVEADWKSQNEDAKRFLLRMLPSKGPNAFIKFVNVLRDEKEHPGHESLYYKLVQHMKGNLPRPESAPAPTDGAEQLILTGPIRHNSLKPPKIGRIIEEGVEARLEQICERLQSLEQKIDYLATSRFSKQSNMDVSFATTHNDKSHRSSEIAGLPSLPPVTHIKASYA